MTDTKESNPKAVHGDKKAGLSYLPFGPVYEIALAMMEGGFKYGKHNYRSMGCKASTYFDAAIGHLVSWHEGADIDEESGIHHLMKAAACLIVMRDSQLMGNNTDDRPIKYPKGVSLRKNPIVQTLLAKYPNPVSPFTEKDHIPGKVSPLQEDRRVGNDRRSNMQGVCGRGFTGTVGRRKTYVDRRTP